MRSFICDTRRSIASKAILSIVTGNGVSYKKAEQNPVITGDMLPDNFSREHFRDPKIWKETDGYYMVVGNKTEDGIPISVRPDKNGPV